MENEQKHRIITDDVQKAANEYNQVKYKYYAFISYRHVEPDQSIAKHLHHIIETFNPPKEFYNNGVKPTFRVFRDREELAAKDLSTSIEDALATSRYLIVICSKRTPLSDWCEKEIETFRALHGDERIIPVLIEGDIDESFPTALKQLRRKGDESLQDILAADIRPDIVLKNDFIGYESLQTNNKQKLNDLTKQSFNLLKVEKYRIMATILGCTFGDLKQRDKERKNKLILTVSSLSGAVFLIFGIFMANAYQKAELARQEAVQSNASILMKTSKDFLKEGDYIKAVLVAKEAMKPITEGMRDYEALKAEEMSIFNDTIYHAGASTLTTIPTKNKLTFMAVSEDDKYVAYGLDNNDTAIASVQNGKLIRRFTGHSQQVKLVDFSKDGKYLASSSFDNTCIIYDMETGDEKVKLEIDGVPMLTKFSIDNSKFFYASLTNNSTNFYVYDTKTWQKIGEMIITDSVKFADIKNDGSEALIVLSENTQQQLTRRSLKDGKIIEVIPRIKKESIDKSYYFTPYKAAYYSRDKENMIFLTDFEIMKVSLKEKKELFKQTLFINSTDSRIISESKNGEKIAVKANAEINILDGKKGNILDQIFFSNISMKYFTYNYDTNTVVGFGENGNFSIWKDKVIVEDNISYGNGIPIEFIFLKDGSKILANSHESQAIKIIDLNSRVSSDPVFAKIIANSNDYSQMLLFDGNNLAVSSDNGKTSKKIETDEKGFYSYILNSKYYAISNNGKYYALTGTMEDNSSNKSKPTLKIYDVQKNLKKYIDINTLSSSFTFTDDSKQILVLDDIEGLKVYDAQGLKLIKTYKDIKDNSGNIMISKDSKVLVINRFSGIASIYNLETDKHIEDIAGEVVNIQNTDDEIILKGIQNNTAFNWSSKSGMTSWEMDETCSQTPLSFSDKNLYNEKSDVLLMIRNNEADRKCYVVDFSTGRLMITLNPSIKKFNVNGHISPDGKVISIDQNYYAKYDSDASKTISYISTSVYKILSEGEVSQEIDKIVSDRTLSKEEKVQIGISVK